MSTPRESQIYITRRTRRILSMLAKAQGEGVTADELAERWLEDRILAEAPDIVVMYQRHADEEAEELEKLKPKESDAKMDTR